jgi:hypothetical protein
MNAGPSIAGRAYSSARRFLVSLAFSITVQLPPTHCRFCPRVRSARFRRRIGATASKAMISPSR